ncbi:MAG: copper oxidase [Planctomycetes bacterium]|nr:copper oxidase [Planctomycetota bacterium]
MRDDRRRFLLRTGGATAAFATLVAQARALPLLGRGAALGARPLPAQPNAPPAQPNAPSPLPLRDGDYRPSVTPDGATLPFRVVDGVKVFHLVAQDVTHEFAPGLVGECYGFNGRVHGPTLEAVEGDRVRIYVTNRLSVSTSVHWHGIRLPNGMDGVGGLTQRPIEPGETFKYEFALPDAGSFMYHSHHDEMTQMAMGLMGMFVVHPRRPSEPLPDRDFVYMLSEWKLEPGTRRPDPNEMTDFNVLTMNGRIYPGTMPLAVRRGERVRLRIGNLSAMDHHPIHLHGHAFTVVATDGGDVPKSARYPETSVLVPVGAVRVIEFVADNPGDWPLHCHMTHHVMTQMGHGLPNLIGTDHGRFDEALSRHVPAFEQVGSDSGAMDGGMAGMGGDEAALDESHDPTIPRNSLPMMGGSGPHGYITMGGMFTLLQVRDELAADGGAGGWYQAPPGTRADVASDADVERDGIAP